MSTYEGPSFSPAEIMSVLREKGIVVTDEDLRRPASDFISDLYTRLLISVNVLHEDEKGQVDFDALEQFENPDLHVASVQAINLYSKVKEVLNLVGCPLEFTLKDLLRPDASRSQLFISALLNFSLYHDSKMVLVHQNLDEVNLLEDQQTQWEAKISQLHAEIAEFDAAIERELPLVQELKAEIEDLNQKIIGLNNQQMSLRAAFRKLKEKTSDMDNEIKQAEFDLVQAVQENELLNGKIVQSPEKLQRMLEKKKLVLEETKNAERLAIQTFQERAAVLEVYAQAFKKMSKSSDKMRSINEQLNNAKSIERDLKALKAKLSEDGVIDKSLEARVVEREGKVEQLQESLKQLEKEREAAFDEGMEWMNEIKLEVESKRCELEARQKEVESVVAMVDANAAKTKEVKQSGEAKVQKLANKCDEIVKQFQEYVSFFGSLLPGY